MVRGPELGGDQRWWRGRDTPTLPPHSATLQLHVLAKPCVNWSNDCIDEEMRTDVLRCFKGLYVTLFPWLQNEDELSLDILRNQSIPKENHATIVTQMQSVWGSWGTIVEDLSCVD